MPRYLLSLVFTGFWSLGGRVHNGRLQDGELGAAVEGLRADTSQISESVPVWVCARSLKELLKTPKVMMKLEFLQSSKGQTSFSFLFHSTANLLGPPTSQWVFPPLQPMCQSCRHAHCASPIHHVFLLSFIF